MCVCVCVGVCGSFCTELRRKRRWRTCVQVLLGAEATDTEREREREWGEWGREY